MQQGRVKIHLHLALLSSERPGNRGAFHVGKLGSNEICAQIEQLLGGETRLPACYSRQNEACQRHDTVAQLAQIKQPTMVMAGDRDPICSLTATRMLSEGLPNVKTEIFANASHFFLIEQPEKFMQVLEAWLSSHSPNSSTSS